MGLPPIFVMPALCRGHPRLGHRVKTWMAGTSPAMSHSSASKRRGCPAQESTLGPAGGRTRVPGMTRSSALRARRSAQERRAVAVDHMADDRRDHVIENEGRDDAADPGGRMDVGAAWPPVVRAGANELHQSLLYVNKTPIRHNGFRDATASRRMRRNWLDEGGRAFDDVARRRISLGE